jgi:hypothetical protein
MKRNSTSPTISRFEITAIRSMCKLLHILLRFKCNQVDLCIYLLLTDVEDEKTDPNNNSTALTLSTLLRLLVSDNDGTE